MPRFGKINERRHQLHEVIRLSGMNLNVNDTDHLLIIKVASIPSARIQVYFIDNDTYFKRKAVLDDADGNFFRQRRAQPCSSPAACSELCCKLGWAPDIIPLQWLDDQPCPLSTSSTCSPTSPTSKTPR